MKELLTVRHPEMTVGELVGLVESRSERIVRSTHVGNQPPHELLIMTALPPGIDVLMVDTIQGNDRYSRPDSIVLDGRTSPICEKADSKGRLVGAVTVTMIGEKKNSDDRLEELVVKPVLGELLSSFHMRAIAELSPNNCPVAMTDYFARHLDILHAAMAQSLLLDEAQRKADSEGKITQATPHDVNVGFFGLEDASPRNQGLLPSLTTMIALDIVISSLVHRADRTLHLAGPDMIRYTRETELMKRVGALATNIACELGLVLSKHRYEVVDITGLSRLVSTSTHASQHQLLRIKGMVTINLEEHDDEVCGSRIMAGCS